MYINDIWNKSYINCGNEMKIRSDRRSERNLCNCVKKPEKKNSGLQRGLNPWPRDTGAMLYQLSYEATDVESRSIVGSYVPVTELTCSQRQWLHQFGSMPVLEEAMTSWFHCSAKNTQKWEKIIAKNKGAFLKACSRSTRSISGTSELAVLMKKPFPCFLNIKSSFVPHYGS